MCDDPVQLTIWLKIGQRHWCIFAPKIFPSQEICIILGLVMPKIEVKEHKVVDFFDISNAYHVEARAAFLVETESSADEEVLTFFRVVRDRDCVLSLASFIDGLVGKSAKLAGEILFPVMHAGDLQEGPSQGSCTL